MTNTNFCSQSGCRWVHRVFWYLERVLDLVRALVMTKEGADWRR